MTESNSAADAVQEQVRQALADHAGKARHWHLADLFADDAGRFETLSRECCGLLVDYSKQRLTGETLDLLRMDVEAVFESVFDVVQHDSVASHWSAS